jgi:hypothetical protein
MLYYLHCDLTAAVIEIQRCSLQQKKMNDQEVGSGFRIQDSTFANPELGSWFWIQDSGFRIQDSTRANPELESWFRIQDSTFANPQLGSSFRI